MATIETPPAAPAEAPPGSVLFVADQDINATIRLTGLGSFDIVKDRNRGIAWPAGEPFAVPDYMADAFLGAYGPTPGNGNVTAEAAAYGRLRGLRRFG